jgi:hypothetical protein
MNSTKALLDMPDLPLEAFKHIGDRKIKPQGDSGGGGGQPADTTQTQTQELPEWARGYAKDVLAKGQALTDISKNPYQTYGGDRTAGFSNLQKQAFAQAGPQGFQSTVGQYMSPYVDQVIQNQIASSNRGYDISAMNEQAKATQQGAFGGGRQAIMQAENERARNSANQNITAQGLQNAFQGATGQYNTGLGQLQNLGNQQQLQRQKELDVPYQEFINQQNQPYKQLSYMSDLIRGTPLGMQSSNQVYQAPGNTLGQVAGLGMQAYGISQMGGGKAAGGSISEYADGGEVKSYAGDEGSVTSDGFMEDALDGQSDKYLMDKKREALSKRDIKTAQMIDEEMAFRASARRGLASGLDEKTSLRLAEGGGIVAFAEPNKRNNYSLVDESMYDASPRTSDEMQQGESSLLNWFRNSKGMPKTEVDQYGQVTGREFPTATADLKPVSDVPAGGPDLLAMQEKRIAANTSKKQGAGPSRMGNVQTATPATPAIGEGRSLSDEYKDAYKMMREGSADEMKAIEALAAKQAGAGDRIKQQGMGRIFAEYGAALAQSAAQRGKGGNRGISGLLMNAAEAAPVATKSIMNTQDAMRAAEANDAKLNMEMAKYRVALAKGDQTAAMSYAQNVRQLQQQQTQLAESIRHNKATEGIASSRAAAGNVGLERAMLQSKSAIWNNSMKQAAKDWGDPLKAKELKNQYGSQKAYAKDLFEQGWSQTMPQLAYLGKLDAGE